ncbi:MAG: FdtA/QdtA family cupin domain-containing protein [Mesorhizobium sp.]
MDKEVGWLCIRTICAGCLPAATIRLPIDCSSGQGVRSHIGSGGYVMHHRTFFDGKVVEIPTATHSDPRGMLTAIQFGDYNFHAVRAFVVTAPQGTSRGGHAHRSGRQLMMQLRGEISIEFRYQKQIEWLVLTQSNRAVLVDAPVWARQTYEGENPSMIVFCDTEYDAENYVLAGAD